MILLLTAIKAQKLTADYVRSHRLNMGLTQEGLAKRSGVSLATLRKFEQKGMISLGSFLKLLMVLDKLDSVVDVIKPNEKPFASIDEVIEVDKKPMRKKGWRK